MICTRPKRVGDVEVDCGWCISCRIKRSREWTLRLVHELEYYNKSCFLTLTYDDKHLPASLSISKTELQKFFKRLRYFSKTDIKFFACGEYGELNGRPHYHAIVFGIDSDYKNFTKYKNSRLWRMKEWNNGFVYVGTVTFSSIGYVTAYVLKKVVGSLADKEYGLRESPFQLNSQGIGKRFALENQVQLSQNGIITLRSVPHTLPRYYKKLMPELNFQDTISSEEHASMVALAKRVTSTLRAGSQENFQSTVEAYRLQTEKNLIAKQSIRAHPDNIHTLTKPRRTK